MNPLEIGMFVGGASLGSAAWWAQEIGKFVGAAIFWLLAACAVVTVVRLLIRDIQ